MFFKRQVFWMLCLAATIVNAAKVGESTTSSQADVSTCAVCHGPDGNSLLPSYPKLAGQPSAYLAKQLRDLKTPNSGRADPVMTPLAEGLSDQDIADLSAYFSQGKVKVGTVEERFLALGKRIYMGGVLEKGLPACTGCHGPSGQGNEAAGYPLLSGQYPEYTIKQLKQFRAAERKNDTNGIMRAVAAKMSDEEIEAVAHYIYGLYQEE